MRRAMLIAVCAGCAGFLAASATVFGYAKLNAWRGFGENFQLGYVVGYLDAVTLAKRKDVRAFGVPVGGRPNYELWRDKVNAYFADPANENRVVADAMGAIGAEMSLQQVKEFHDRANRTPGNAPSPAVSGVATPAPARASSRDSRAGDANGDGGAGSAGAARDR